MENYFWNTEDIIQEKKMYILIIYDIVNNKRRTTFSKKMNGYGFRVQKSAFEAMISEKLYQNLLKEIPSLICKEEDSVRIYHIIGKDPVKLFGVNESIKDEEIIII